MRLQKIVVQLTQIGVLHPSLHTDGPAANCFAGIICCTQHVQVFSLYSLFLQVKKRGLSLEAVKLQIQQLPLIILSLVGAVMTGMIAPGFSLLLSEILIVRTIQVLLRVLLKTISCM